MFVNLTPHNLNVFDVEGKNPVIIAPSGMVARVAVVSRQVCQVEGVALLATTFGQVQGVPEPKEGTIYVVSLLVRQACPERTDLASPGELVRDAVGQPTGCKGLAVNS